jgi:hypothetical protein
MSKLTDSEIFNAWKNHVSEELGKARFTAENNKREVSDLVQQFKDNGVDIDDARSYLRQIVKFLVTEEGQKGGKSKRTGRPLEGWTDAVKMYFEAAIVDQYSDTIDKETVSSKDEITDYLMGSDLVKAWVKNKFGSINQKVLYETCRDSTSLNLQMQEELLNAPWSSSGEDIPDWVRIVLV